jgi:hypothetical protein
MKTLFVLLTTLFAWTFTHAATNTFDGSWQWHFTMPDGSQVHPKLKLKQNGATLTGTSILRPGTETRITNGIVNGDDVQFEVVRERNGIAATTRYSGKRDGDIIRGKVESNWTGEIKTYDWEARRAAGIDGTWKWTNTFNNRSFEMRVTLKLEGDKLTGSTPGFRGGRPTPIKNGTFKDGEVYFEIERGRDDFKSFSKYEGKLEGDTITGTIETTFGSGEPRDPVDWDAQRAD